MPNIGTTKIRTNVYLDSNMKAQARIIPNKDKTSQKLAFIALDTGLEKKNSVRGAFYSYRENMALRGIIS